MCYSPIKIKNRSLKLTIGTPLYLTVGCGRCEECLQKIKNDYYIRTIYEHQQCVLDGGFTYFETLTYNNESLPNHFGINCFSKHDIRLFFQRLKTNLKNIGFPISKDTKNSLRYILSSEYGEQNSRPHYHLLLFVRIPGISPTQLKKCINLSWALQYDKKATAQSSIPVYKPHKGFTNPIVGVHRYKDQVHQLSADYWVVPPSGGWQLYYVSKYITKQFGFEQDFKSIEEKLRDPKYEIPEKDKKLGSDRQSIYKAIAPFHLNSNGFGLSLLDKLTPQNIHTNKINTPYSIKGIDKTYSIPAYIRRKLFMTLDMVERYDGKIYPEWSHNSLSIHEKLLTANEQIQRSISSYQDFVANADRLTRQLVESKQADIRSLSNINSVLQGHEEDGVWLDGLKDLVDFRQLAIFANYYRDTFLPRNLETLPDLYSQIKSKYDKTIDPPQPPIVLDHLKPLKDRLAQFEEHKLCGDEFPIFAYCELFMALFDQFNDILHKDKYISEVYKQQVLETLRKCPA